ncbi:MAG: DUF1501 domain-containing protein, partial [Verrucomicrobia bacterium]|nr:DUF1501 domain-containing protein [Verrucomicrobiota bacterium]
PASSAPARSFWSKTPPARAISASPSTASSATRFSCRSRSNGMSDHPPARPASTILLLRNGPTGLEVLMVERNVASEFASGALVFPGGRVDDGDMSPDLHKHCRRAPDEDTLTTGLRVAGVRETWEEARMLLARRLVESGVRFVSMTYGGWDHHDNIKRAMEGQMPNFDQAFARLIRDLDERGMLDSTLVFVTSEFGRTPKINQTAGRDHWPKVFSIVMAGGGVKRGYIHGSSDAQGAEPDNDPLTVSNYSATIYSLIGIDPERRLMSPGSRPQAIVIDGHVEKDLLA